MTPLPEVRGTETESANIEGSGVSGSSSGMSTGAIVGIAVGVVSAAALAGLLVVLLVRRDHRGGSGSSDDVEHGTERARFGGGAAVSSSDDEYFDIMNRSSSFRATRIIENITNTLIRGENGAPSPRMAEEGSVHDGSSQAPYFAAVPSSITTSPLPRHWYTPRSGA